jgi:hypothetical protein
VGHFASHIEEDYPTTGLEAAWWPEYEESCTYCGGKGYREFPVPLEDPQYDECPDGCDEMYDTTQVPLLNREFTPLEVQAFVAASVQEGAFAVSQAVAMRGANRFLADLGLIDRAHRTPKGYTSKKVKPHARPSASTLSKRLKPAARWEREVARFRKEHHVG